MRDEMRRLIGSNGAEPQEQSWSSRVVDYLKGMRDFEVQHNTAKAVAEMQANQPAPKSLPDQLRELIGQQHQEPGDTPALNSEILLQVAAGSQDAPRSVRQEIAKLLHDYHEQHNQ